MLVLGDPGKMPPGKGAPDSSVKLNLETDIGESMVETETGN